MIREFQRDDINKVADIWLDTNIKAHNFIPAEYWKSNFRSVKEALLLDRKSTRLNSSHDRQSRMPSSA